MAYIRGGGGAKTNTMLGMYTNSRNRIWASLIFENSKNALSFLAKYYGGGGQIMISGTNQEFQNITEFPTCDYDVTDWTTLVREANITSKQYTNINVSQYKYIALTFRTDNRPEIQNIEWS